MEKTFNEILVDKKEKLENLLKKIYQKIEIDLAELTEIEIRKNNEKRIKEIKENLAENNLIIEAIEEMIIGIDNQFKEWELEEEEK